MSKLLAAIVASTFALSAVPGFAKTEELNVEQRAELRTRAEQLITERAANPAPVRAGVGHTPKAKKNPATKAQPKT